MNWWFVAKWVGVALAIILVVKMIGDEREQAVMNKVERQNNEAAQNADIARLGFDDCVGDDKLWDFGAGKCTRTQSRGRD